jgi:hypothetical protein
MDKLQLVKIIKEYTEQRVVEFFLKGKIKGVYNSKDYGNRLKASFETKGLNSGRIWRIFSIPIYDDEFFELIEDICDNNAIALIHMKHESKFIRKLVWYKLKYKACIPIKEKIHNNTQKARYRSN